MNLLRMCLIVALVFSSGAYGEENRCSAKDQLMQSYEENLQDYEAEVEEESDHLEFDLIHSDIEFKERVIAAITRKDPEWRSKLHRWADEFNAEVLARQRMFEENLKNHLKNLNYKNDQSLQRFYEDIKQQGRELCR